MPQSSVQIYIEFFFPDYFPRPLETCRINRQINIAESSVERLRVIYRRRQSLDQDWKNLPFIQSLKDFFDLLQVQPVSQNLKLFPVPFFSHC
jgi:hypothetical protein